MKLLSMFRIVSYALVAALLASCATQPATDPSDPLQFVNPYPPGTHEHFTAEPSYPKTMDSFKNEGVLSRTNSSNSKVIIDLAKQRGMLMNGDEVAIDYPISSGRKSHPTPRGVFPITEKIIDKRSNLYGRIYDAEGVCVITDADATKDEIPEGGRFQGASMRYWMRMTSDGVGHHVGPLPKSRNPVSHSCIRGPASIMPIVFSKTKIGTPIEVR